MNKGSLPVQHGCVRIHCAWAALRHPWRGSLLARADNAGAPLAIVAAGVIRAAAEGSRTARKPS
jgi:hypothetical protein